MASEEAACNLITCLQSLRCHLVLHCGKARGLEKVHQTSTALLYCAVLPFYFTHSSSFSQPWHLNYLISIWGAGWHHWRLLIRLHAASTGATKGFKMTVFTCAVVPPKTCKWTLMSRIGGVTLFLLKHISNRNWLPCIAWRIRPLHRLWTHCLDLSDITYWLVCAPSAF